MSEDKTHTHSYIRVKHPTRRDLFMCSDAKCNCRVNVIFLPGKECLCPNCGDTFIIERKFNLEKQSRLHCRKCKKTTGIKKSKEKLAEEVFLAAFKAKGVKL